MNIKNIINSLPIQFLIGGLTVAGISYFSNHLANTAISGVIASIPIGLPSSIFVKDSKLKGYSTHLLIMTGVLFLATLMFWFLFNHMKINKYVAVLYSMLFWAICGLFIIFI